MSFPLTEAKKAGVAGFSEERWPLLWEYVGRIEGEEGYVRAGEVVKEVEGGGEGKGR